MVAMTRAANELDRDLCELAGPGWQDCRPSHDWDDLAALCIVIADEYELSVGTLCRAGFRAETPCAGAQALLDVILDEHAVLTEGDAD